MSERNDARVQREAPNGIVQFQLLREDGRYCEALYALDRDGVLWLRWYENEEWGQWVRCNATLDATGHETAGSEAEEREAVRQVMEYLAANTGRIVERIKTAGQERLAAVAPSPETSGDTQGSPPAPAPSSPPDARRWFAYLHGGPDHGHVGALWSRRAPSYPFGACEEVEVVPAAARREVETAQAEARLRGETIDALRREVAGWEERTKHLGSVVLRAWEVLRKWWQFSKLEERDEPFADALARIVANAAELRAELATSRAALEDVRRVEAWLRDWVGEDRRTIRYAVGEFEALDYDGEYMAGEQSLEALGRALAQEAGDVQ